MATSDALRHHGVDSMLLKGAGLARRLDTDRLYADVDLLVAPDTVTAAQDALLAAGYRPKLPPTCTTSGRTGTSSPGTPPGHCR